MGAANAPAATAPFKRPRREDEVFFSVMVVSFSYFKTNPPYIMHNVAQKKLRVNTKTAGKFSEPVNQT
jgi:hypothetical protein